MEIDQEKKFEIELLCVLRKIKRLSFYHAEGDTIQYRMFSPQSLLYEEFPFKIDESSVIEVLVRQNYLKRIKPLGGAPVTAVVPELPEIGSKRMISIYYLKILQPKFGELYTGLNRKRGKQLKDLLKDYDVDYRKRLRYELKQILTAGKFGKKEKEFIKLLYDFKPHKIKEIKSEIKTKAIAKLKEAVLKKLKGTGFSIITNKGFGYQDSTYQLEFTPPHR